MKQYTVFEWCEIFGVNMIDADGFLISEVMRNTPQKMPLERFVTGIVACTIQPVNTTRYEILKKLM
jgi:hypothetical protein